jgi:hypothetical protein
MIHQSPNTDLFVVCIRNDGYEASLERCKIYRAITDTDATDHKHLRVIDESGEDYLYPAEYFMPIELPVPLQQALSKAG